MLGNIAKRWRELNGQYYWKDLLDPLDIDLRQNILFYGELCQAIYDSFIREKKSSFAGAPKYARKHLLSKVAVSYGQQDYYEVTKYIFATSSIEMPDSFIIKSLSREAWSKESNWMGFIAVSTDEGKRALGRRDILVGWRGTVRTLEWVDDLDFTMVPLRNILGPGHDNIEGLVHRGWTSIYTSEDPRSPFTNKSAREQTLDEISKLMSMYQDDDLSITITGHSLGAALSTLSAIDIVYNGLNKTPNSTQSCPVTAFVFASPKVGDYEFKNLFNNMADLRLLRVHNANDVVPNYPPFPYLDAGIELMIDNVKSPFLKSPGSPSSWHSLECYLHGIAGTQGKKKFRLVIDRDISLVNKATNALKDELLVIENWWVSADKCMVKGIDGHWKLIDHEDDNLD